MERRFALSLAKHFWIVMALIALALSSCQKEQQSKNIAQSSPSSPASAVNHASDQNKPGGPPLSYAGDHKVEAESARSPAVSVFR
jgi:hypothetical protein